MERLKKHIATALIVTMMCSQALTVPAAQADETVENGFQMVGGNWTYWKNGKMQTNEFEKINDDWYYFDADGFMVRDELFERTDGIGDEEEPIDESYAFPNGKIADNMWVLLNDDGKISVDGSGNWYYFAKQKKDDDDDLNFGKAYKAGRYGIPRQLYPEEKRNYYFDEEGKMISREFAEIVAEAEDGSVIESTNFFEYDGQQAKDKWLYIEDAWYYFLDGKMNTEPLDADYKLIEDNIASDSNALASSSNAMYEFSANGKLTSEIDPYPVVEAINLRSASSMEIEVGEEVELVFDVQLASSSNVAHDGLKYGETRDIWLEQSWEFDVDGADSLFDRRYVVDSDNKTITISYTPNYPGTIEITPVVDGVGSDQAVTIESKWPKNAEPAQVNEIQKLLKEPGDNALAAVKIIRYLLDLIEDSNVIKNVWLPKENDIQKLEKDYLLAKGVKKTDPIVSSNAERLLGTGTPDIIGAALNADEGTEVGLAIDVANKLKLDENYQKQLAFDLSCGDMTEFSIPVIVKMPLPKGISKDGLVLYHDHEGTITKLDYKLSDNMVTFVTDGMSTFAFAGNAEVNQGGGSGGGGSSSGGGGGSSIGSSSAAGTVTTDAKKGHVNSLTGIITGSGSGYSSWNSDEKGWKLQYADGTFAAGTMMTSADGSTYEQPAWEQINGAWYPFGADGYIKSGMVYDPALGGTFYIDINTGMKTGWQNIDGVWHYFNTKADGKNGMMLKDTLVDGYYIDANGVWDGQEKKAV